MWGDKGGDEGGRGGDGEEVPRANRLEKSVSVRRKRPSLSLFSQEIRFLEDCLSLKALTSRLFSSRLLVLCKKPVAQEAGSEVVHRTAASEGQLLNQVNSSSRVLTSPEKLSVCILYIRALALLAFRQGGGSAKCHQWQRPSHAREKNSKQSPFSSLNVTVNSELSQLDSFHSSN